MISCQAKKCKGQEGGVGAARLLAHPSPGTLSGCGSASSSRWLPAGAVAFPPAAACNMSPAAL